MRQAVIRCDAGAAIGGGHVIRCSALGAALARAGMAVSFAVSDETLETIPSLAQDFPGSLAGMLVGKDDAERLVRRWPDGVSLAVVDHYGLGEEFERRLEGWAERVLVIDDAPARKHACTHLLDTTLNRNPAEYRGLVDEETVFACGSRYALLREPFTTQRAAGVPPPPSSVRRILVSMGLSDNADATRSVLEGLRHVAGVTDVDVVLGGAAPHRQAIRELLAQGPAGWRLHLDMDAEAMAELTASADLVIGAPGSASYERCCLGRPALLIITAENQLPNASALREAGAAMVLGELSAGTPQAVREAVLALSASPGRLSSMSEAASAVCDGRGAERICLLLAPD